MPIFIFYFNIFINNLVIDNYSTLLNKIYYLIVWLVSKPFWTLEYTGTQLRL